MKVRSFVLSSKYQENWREEFMRKWIAAAIGLILLPTLFYLLLTREPASRQPTLSNFCIPLMPPQAKVVAGYGKILNFTTSDITLNEVTCSTAKMTEIHKTIIDEDGDMDMQRIEKLDIAIGKTISLSPGGKHIMIYLNKEANVNGPIRCRFDFAPLHQVEVLASRQESCG